MEQSERIDRIGPGIHDSSAALAPYLIGLEDPFMLISTGTWSITFNPFNRKPLTYEELERDCLCYLNIRGDQIKSSRLFLGSEYDHQRQKIEEFFGVELQAGDTELDVALLNQLIQDQNPEKKLQLEKANNSGPFPQEKSGNWQLDQFSSPKEACHQLMLDLVSIQRESVKLAEGSSKVESLIVTGGFSQNELFISLLSSFFPEKKVYISSLPDASALGAAMVVKEPVIASQARNDLKELLGLKRIKPESDLKVAKYSWG